MIGISEKLEPLFLLMPATMAAIALVPAYRRKHRRKVCLVLFGSGILCLLARRYASPTLESAASIFGAGLLITAHILNITFLRRCDCCDQRRDQSHDMAP